MRYNKNVDSEVMSLETYKTNEKEDVYDLTGIGNINVLQKVFEQTSDEDKIMIVSDDKTMNFGEVIVALKEGKKITREGWNGKGMYIWLLKPCTIEKSWIKDPLLLDAFGDKDTLDCGYCIKMKNAKGGIDIWHPSIPDIFAEDWLLYE